MRVRRAASYTDSVARIADFLADIVPGVQWQLERRTRAEILEGTSEVPGAPGVRMLTLASGRMRVLLRVEEEDVLLLEVYEEV